MIPTIRIVCEGLRLKIYINDTLHVYLNPRKTLHFQTWIEVQKPFPYVIEYYVDGEEIKTEYDSFEKWKEIITQLDKMKCSK
jgi:hypothetical protein